MRLVDTNLLVNAFRQESEHHEAFRGFVEDMVSGDSAYAVSDFVVNGFLRIVTNRRIYLHPDSLDRALEYAATIREQAHAVVVQPGPRHWEIFSRLCRQAGAVANIIPDAYLAALAIEHGCEFVTCDKDFSRFEGLRVRHPLN
jgi:uncharacterized protein